MCEDIRSQIQDRINRPLSVGAAPIFKALEQTNIYCFKYYPKLKLIVVPEKTQQAWQCKPYYENMPDSLCEEFVDIAYAEQFKAMYHAIDNGVPSASLVFRFKDMKTWSRVTLTTILWDGDEKPEECIAVVENLSAAKNTEKEYEEINRSLRLSTQVFQMAAETTDSIVFLFDTKRQSIMVTDTTADQWGVMAEQTGVPYQTAESGIVHESSKAEYIRLHEEMMRGALTASGTVRLCDAFGSSGYYQLTFQALLDENGKPTGKAAGIYKNITETLRRSKRQDFIIESLGNTYSSIYYVEISTLVYERISEKEATVLGIPESGIWSDGYVSYVKGFVDEPYQEAMMSFAHVDTYEERLGENENISLEYQRADKSWRKAFMLPAEYDENGRISSVIFAVQKIDAEKKKELETQKALKEAYEAAQIANRAKTIFLSNMSHDIRTPMNAIVGMTAIAAANIDNREKVNDCLKKITASSRHLLGLINEVLDMSKIESGKIDLNEERFCISDLMEELITINHSAISAKQHTLNVTVNDLVHENVIGDSTRLQQVFTNLLTNAIKYTPDGGTIDIVISEKQTNKPAIGWYEVIFRDNGIGMSKEYQQVIFDPFSRANDGRITGIQGTGLGMPIARNIIRMMNGDITVESNIDEGSTFKVSFALKLQDDKEIDYTEFVGLPILVVDDDVVSCESTCAILDSLTMNSEWVTSGKEAVEKTAEHHKRNDDYYAVILDWKMPEMDGIATAKAIRREVGDEMPIIVLTAYDWSDIEQEAKECGINAFLSKPLFKSRLIDLFSDFVKSADSKSSQPQTTEALKERDFSGKRILLAEDNELNREIAVELLSMMKITVETAENGQVCLEKFAASAPGYYDLIFMDIQMPVMDGYGSARAIRALDRADAAIPIVAMTANAFSADVRAAFDSGMNGHLSKPISIENIIKVLELHWS